MSEDGLPRVCIINGSDRNSDLDSVDPNLKGMLGNGRILCLKLRMPCTCCASHSSPALDCATDSNKQRAIPTTT